MSDHDHRGTREASPSGAPPAPIDAAPFSSRIADPELHDEIWVLRTVLATLSGDPVGNLDAILKTISVELRVLAVRARQHNSDGQLALALHAVAEQVIDRFADGGGRGDRDGNGARRRRPTSLSRAHARRLGTGC